jgi:hypothetical protein
MHGVDGHDVRVLEAAERLGLDRAARGNLNGDQPPAQANLTGQEYPRKGAAAQFFEQLEAEELVVWLRPIRRLLILLRNVGGPTKEPMHFQQPPQ